MLLAASDLIDRARIEEQPDERERLYAEAEKNLRYTVDDLTKENPKVNGDWRIGCGMVMGWHTQAAGILEPELVGHWCRFAEAKPFWH